MGYTNERENVFYRYRAALAIFMCITSLSYSIRFWGEWSNFGAVISAQLFFGQGFYCYVSRRTIRLAPGGIRMDHPKEARLLVGSLALLVYLGMFAFNGYGRPWGW